MCIRDRSSAEPVAAASRPNRSHRHRRHQRCTALGAACGFTGPRTSSDLLLETFAQQAASTTC
eukprot:6347795-Alexandrium_andersonii.AAC.1